MTEYPGTSLRTRNLGRHYDLVSWDAIMTSYPGDAIMTEYPGTPL